MLDPRNPIPQIDFWRAPADERDELRLLNRTLWDVNNFVAEFEHALQLFDYCLAQQQLLGPHGPFGDWCVLAAKATPIAIWNFRHSMDSANAYANKSPYVSVRLSRVLLGQAFSTFDKEFHDFAALRHAVAHAGELAKTKAAFDENTFSGSFIGSGILLDNVRELSVRNSLFDRSYVNTIGGKVVTVDISTLTLQKLIAVRTLFFRAFQEGPPVSVAPTRVG